MNDARAGRVGTRCKTSGMTRFNCPCFDCSCFRAELKHWNKRLAADGLAVDRGTSDYTAAEHRRRRNQAKRAATK